MRQTNVNLDILPKLPRDESGPTFNEPWEAQAFAMTVELHRQGLFSWSEWASTLADEIKAETAQQHWDDGSQYYTRWLAALEKLVLKKKLVADGELEARATDWAEAAKATPHGEPIRLNR